MENINEQCYLISIDGGGTKTGICIYDCNRDVTNCGVCGGGNYKVHGISTVRERIQNCLQEMLPDIKNIPAAVRYLVMGLSGCDSSQDIAVYEEMMQSLGFIPERMMICNDSEMLFRSVSDAPGICTIAGTGTISLAFTNNGSVYRTGGWGAPISDEGSGYWIGAEIIRAYFSWIDGMGEYNDFFSLFPEKLTCNSDEEAAAILAAMKTSQIAEWAKLVLERADENSLCKKITAAAAEKAAALTVSSYKKAGFLPEQEITIVESGSLFKNIWFDGVFRNSIHQKLPEYCFHFLRSDRIPAEDGILLAKKMALKMGKTQSFD